MVKATLVVVGRAVLRPASASIFRCDIYKPFCHQKIKKWLIDHPPPRRRRDLHRRTINLTTILIKPKPNISSYSSTNHYQHACRHISYNSLCCLRLRWSLRRSIQINIMCRKVRCRCSSKVVESSWVFNGWTIYVFPFSHTQSHAVVYFCTHLISSTQKCLPSTASKSRCNLMSTSGHPCLNRHPNLGLSLISCFTGDIVRPWRVYCLVWEWLVPTVSGYPSCISSTLHTYYISNIMLWFSTVGWQIRLGNGEEVTPLTLGDTIREAHPKSKFS